MAHLSNRRRKEIGKLTQRKYRKKLGQTLVEGQRALTSVVEAGAPLIDIIVTPEARMDDRLAELLAQVGVPVYEENAQVIAELSSVTTHQGVLAVVRREIIRVEELVDCTSLLVLDGVQDPGNVGTLMRTAAWFGTDAVIGGRGTAGFFNPKVVRAGMGAHWDLRLARADEIDHTLAFLQSRGFTVYGADLEGASARQWNAAPQSALVLGSEAHGLSKQVRKQLSERISIPGKRRNVQEGTESLNVAVSGAILLYEWLGE